MMRPQPLTPAAGGAARVVEAWTRAALDALAGEPLDACTLKWFGRPRAVAPFRDRHGVEGPFAGSSPFIAGLARTLALAPVHARDLAAGLGVAADALRGGASFAFCHTKAPDEAGHTKDPAAKRAVIEALDADLAVLAEPPFADAIVCVTGDHGTPACGSDIIHSGDAVPLIVTGPGVWADGLAFGERVCRGGSLGVLRGADLTPVLLDLAGRAPFLGARVGSEPFSQCPWPV
jgi:2,3-bisphosphoglycerate-independent phosphoglycerate mutase